LQFINDLLGSAKMKTGNNLESITGEMSYATCTINHHGIDHSVALVDTVGWANSNPKLTKAKIFADMVRRLSSL
jgi:hypothetical protein